MGEKTPELTRIGGGLHRYESKVEGGAGQDGGEELGARNRGRVDVESGVNELSGQERPYGGRPWIVCSPRQREGDRCTVQSPGSLGVDDQTP